MRRNISKVELAAGSSRDNSPVRGQPTVMLELRAASPRSKAGMATEDAGEQIMRQFLQQQTTQQPSLEGGKGVQLPATASSPVLFSGHICGLRLHLNKWQFLSCIFAVACLVLLAAVIGGVLSIRRAVPVAYSCGNAAQVAPQLTTDLPFLEDFTSMDPCVWSFDVGDGADYGLAAWGNQELQCYTSSPNNVDIIPNPDRPGDGLLRIRQAYSSQPQPCVNSAASTTTSLQWTSGKIHTKNKRGFQWKSSSSDGSKCTPIVVESRVKVPHKAGRWSAFWMMPQPQWGVPVTGCPAVYPAAPGAPECGAYGPWPRSGEIDIMEQVNKDSKIMGTVHYANSAGYHVYTGGNTQLPPDIVQGWNVYKAVWGCDWIKWYVNDKQFYELNRQQLGALWPFDQPFFLQFNTAIGGLLTGFADVDQSPSEMLVDYVKVSYLQ